MSLHAVEEVEVTPHLFVLILRGGSPVKAINYMACTLTVIYRIAFQLNNFLSFPGPGDHKSKHFLCLSQVHVFYAFFSLFIQTYFPLFFPKAPRLNMGIIKCIYFSAMLDHIAFQQDQWLIISLLQSNCFTFPNNN